MKLEAASSRFSPTMVIPWFGQPTFAPPCSSMPVVRFGLQQACLLLRGGRREPAAILHPGTKPGMGSPSGYGAGRRRQFRKYVPGQPYRGAGEAVRENERGPHAGPLGLRRERAPTPRQKVQPTTARPFPGDMSRLVDERLLHSARHTRVSLGQVTEAPAASRDGLPRHRRKARNVTAISTRKRQSRMSKKTSNRALSAPTGPPCGSWASSLRKYPKPWAFHWCRTLPRPSAG